MYMYAYDNIHIYIYIHMLRTTCHWPEQTMISHSPWVEALLPKYMKQTRKENPQQHVAPGDLGMYTILFTIIFIGRSNNNFSNLHLTFSLDTLNLSMRIGRVRERSSPRGGHDQGSTYIILYIMLL